MFKVSFKNEECPAKRVEKTDDKTIVLTLTGRVKLPEWWCNMPEEIWDYMDECKSFEFTESIHDNYLTIKVSGKAVCSDKDKYDGMTGERIAESRAKLKLYRFMFNLSSKIVRYYSKLLYGYPEADFAYGGNSTAEVRQKYSRLLLTEESHLKTLIDAT